MAFVKGDPRPKMGLCTINYNKDNKPAYRLVFENVGAWCRQYKRKGHTNGEWLNDLDKRIRFQVRDEVNPDWGARKEVWIRTKRGTLRQLSQQEFINEVHKYFETL